VKFGAAAQRRRAQKGWLVGEVACQFVLDSELFFLEAVEKVFIRVTPMLFFVDQRVERRVLRFESLG
jgi:hypothetical protein